VVGEGVEVAAAGGEDDLPGGVAGHVAQGGGVEVSVAVEVGGVVVQSEDGFEVGGDVDQWCRWWGVHAVGVADGVGEGSSAGAVSGVRGAEVGRARTIGFTVARPAVV